MKDYIVRNSLIQGAYVTHWDEKCNTGYVELYEGAEPSTHLFPSAELLDALSLEALYLLPMLIAAWYKKNLFVEFTIQEFIEFAENFMTYVPEQLPNNITGCLLAFQEEDVGCRFRMTSTKNLIMRDAIEMRRIMRDCWQNLIKAGAPIVGETQIKVHDKPHVSSMLDTVTWKITIKEE